MNKKFLMFGLPILAIALVSAVAYYAFFSVTINVSPSITFSDDCEDELSDVYDGEIYTGKDCVLTNNAPSERNLVITTDAEDGIDVTYNGKLSLTEKDSEWKPIGEPIEVTYTIIGDTFEVTGVQEGYTAIYYKDNVVGLEGRLANPQPAISIVGIGNLPQSDDANWNELANYCELPDEYNQCRGAKIWIVPNGDLTDSTLNWANMANYYYEMDLIQYNSDGEITLSPGASLTIIPVYKIGVGVSGPQVITTTIA